MICRPVFGVVCFTTVLHCAQVLSFPGWSDAGFVIYFVLSCAMGFVLMYGIIVCTNHNSALTTTVVGVLKVVQFSLRNFCLTEIRHKCYLNSFFAYNFCDIVQLRC